MSDSPRLPARPSLEQLAKQAKDLLRALRAGDPEAAERFRKASPSGDPPALAGAQFVIAREYGFESWAKMKHHVESLRPPGISQYERLAKQLAAAYTAGDATAVREINWTYGTGFVADFHDPEKMRRFLTNWYASTARADEIALADAQRMVAHFHGFPSWEKFAVAVTHPREDARPPAFGMSASPPFYRIDWRENAIQVAGPISGEDWEKVAGVIAEHRIARVQAGGATDAAVEMLSRLDHITALNFDGTPLLTDDGLMRVARLPRLEELNVSGWKGQITDRGLTVLRHLPALRRFEMCWQQRVSDAGMVHLASCERLEHVNLLGSATGDGAIRALACMPYLAHLNTGRGVTDAGIPLLHEIPTFKTWHGGAPEYGLMAFEAKPNHLMLDGPFTDAGLARLAGLDGVFGLGFFWHCPNFTAAGLAALRDLPRLGFLGCGGERCDDGAMRHIAAIPCLRMLMAQGTVAGDEGFAALSASPTIEYIWGRECPNLGSGGFTALARMPALRGLAVSCKGVSDAALAALGDFPALRELMPMDVADAGFRHVARCERLERLWCMYCRHTGDEATEHIAGLNLRTYYAGQTEITDLSLEILARMHSLERLEFWACPGITDAGVALLASLPRLVEISLDGLPGVTRDAAALFPAGVRVSYSG
jgi:hypothetical protein